MILTWFGPSDRHRPGTPRGASVGPILYSMNPPSFLNSRPRRPRAKGKSQSRGRYTATSPASSSKEWTHRLKMLSGSSLMFQLAYVRCSRILENRQQAEPLPSAAGRGAPCPRFLDLVHALSQVRPPPDGRARRRRTQIAAIAV